MDRNFARALPLVLKHEGGFANNPNDPGGATNKGVTIGTFRAYVKPGGTVEDLRNITNQQVATVYYRHYWAKVNAQALPSGIDYAVFDFAVNSGPNRAVKYLQAVLRVEVDGRVGPKTIAAAEKADARDVINALCSARLDFLKRITNKGKRMWDTFGKGWERRVSDVRRDALLMVGHPADVKEVPVEVPVEVEKPVMPPAVEKEAEKAERRTWWQWLLAVPLAGIGAFYRDYPEVAWAATGAVMVIAIVALVGGRGFVRRVKEIADEVKT